MVILESAWALKRKKGINPNGNNYSGRVFPPIRQLTEFKSLQEVTVEKQDYVIAVCKDRKSAIIMQGDNPLIIGANGEDRYHLKGNDPVWNEFDCIIGNSFSFTEATDYYCRNADMFLIR
jgi:hypothetical protein